jgi:Trypsin-like peptidase domain
MQRRLLPILILVTSARVEAACVDPATIPHSTVNITRYFDSGERAPPGVTGISATGWFLSPTSIVTVGHVAAAMKLSDRTWKTIEVREGDDTQSIPARIQRLAGSNAEKIAVVELQTRFSGAETLRLRMEPLLPEEPVVSLAYPGGRLRVVGGRFVQYGDGGRLAGTALLEMYDGNDRLALDHGSSGAPILDCASRVTAVVSNLFMTSMEFASRMIRIPTAWGTPNVVSVPVPVLRDVAMD